jgi:hypothetical protein
MVQLLQHYKTEFHLLSPLTNVIEKNATEKNII